METLSGLFDLVLHIDKMLGPLIATYGVWIYAVLALIVFGETGLVVLPFLPGDSLLFVAGAFCATGHLDAPLLIGLLFAAAVLGNTVNYLVGGLIGHRLETIRIPLLKKLIDPAAIQRTHAFYERHGGKTIILARFLPVLRTLAPFVAGMSAMSWVRFQWFSAIGAALWVAGFVIAGYFFGNLPVINQNLNVIVLVGAGAAIVPVMLGGLVKLLRRGRAQ